MTDYPRAPWFAALVCFVRNHRAHPDYDAMVWRCDRCGASGPKLWMTGAWLVDRTLGPVATYAGLQKLASVTALMQDRARDWARGR